MKYDCSVFNVKDGTVISQGVFNKSKTKITMLCHKCNKESVYSATVLKSKIKNGKWCSVCNTINSRVTSKLISESSAILRINSVDSSYSFIKWVGEKYVSFTKTKAEIMCSRCKKPWISNLNNFVLKNKGCPNCCQMGFNSSKPAIFYINRIKYSEQCVIKYGITSNYKNRLYQQSRGFSGEISKIYIREFETGKTARELESFITKKFYDIRGVVPKSILIDGYTETLPFEALDELITIVNGWKG